MRQFLRKYRILFWIGMLLLGGFLSAGIAVYHLSRTALERDIADQALPRAGDALRAEIRAQAARPKLIAAALANDGTVRDWLQSGESDSQPLVRHLADVRDRYGAVTAFLVSDRSLNYYHAEGMLKRMQENDPRDAWFFRMRASASPASGAAEAVDGNSVIIYVNHRVLDRDGNFLGVAGVGLRAEGVAGLIANQERIPGRRAYLVDAQGKVVLAGAAGPAPGSGIDQLPGLQGGETPVVEQIVRGGGKVFVSARALPELGWHLLLEQDDAAALRPARRLFMLVLAIGAGVTLAALALLVPAWNRLHRRLEAMAGADPLTCLLNRQAFDIVFRQSMLDADRSGQPLSAILFDLDFFRQVNDRHGDVGGDEVLRMVAQIARTMVRESDVLARWGGEEFVVLLKDCPLERAVAVAEKIRTEIDGYDFSAVAPDSHVTVSLGVAQHELGEAASMLLRRADEALCKAKANGRNRLHVARTGGWAQSPADVASS